MNGTPTEKNGLHIVIMDDEEHPRDAFHEAIQQAFGSQQVSLEPWVPNGEEVAELERREKQFREEGHWEPKRELPSLDGAEVLVLDWDLLFLQEGAKEAEPWAYLARCFSNVGVILMVNRWGGLPNPFDLGLRGDPFQREDQRSFADLDVGQEQLGMSRLWLGRNMLSQDDETSFHPWYWPVLATLVEDWPKRIEDVVRALMENPCTTVRDFLEFDEESWRWLPRKARAFLDSASNRAPCREEVGDTGPFLIDLLMAGRGWSYKHQRVVYKRLGKLKGTLNEDEWRRTVLNIARPIASLLSKWLEWLVLPEQDVLVDAPHLAERFPSLVGENAPEENWQALAWRRGDGSPPQALVRFEEKIWEYRFLPPGKEFWASRPLWRWRLVKDEESIPEVVDPWGNKTQSVVGEFLEDASSFGSPESGQPFEADVESPFSERFIKRFQRVEYIPSDRLL